MNAGSASRPLVEIRGLSKVYWRGNQGVELVKLGSQEGLVRKQALVLADQGGRGRAGQRVLDDVVVLGGAQKDAD